MANDPQAQLRIELVDYLEHARTHAPFAVAVHNFPENVMNKKLLGVPYTAWMVIEHIRRTQSDMVDFMQHEDYKGMEWPKDYWPDIKEKADGTMWLTSVKSYDEDLAALKEIVMEPGRDLLAKVPWGEGQTVLREVMQAVDHTGYHVGELILMRRMMKNWKS